MNDVPQVVVVFQNPFQGIRQLIEKVWGKSEAQRGDIGSHSIDFASKCLTDANYKSGQGSGERLI